MLDPSIRQIYLDQLRPPEGYHLDRAIATTFSLDLMSLLMAPIAMALQDYRLPGNANIDPVAIMEALNRTTDRFTVFCQKGRISIPTHDTLLYSYLEKVVVEVNAPNARGSFHPKIWLLRYVGSGEDQAVIYRFLCLSRNLTFDKSWDTILLLEGDLEKDRKKGIGLNRPLGQFIQYLSDLAADQVLTITRDSILLMAEEVTKVRFKTPDGFDEILRFIPIGIPGYMRFPKMEPYKRALIMSPFISESRLSRLTDSGNDHVIISRLEALDGLPGDTYKSIKANARFFIMDDSAEKPENSGAENQDSDVFVDTQVMSGLHAKLIITENGAQANIFTGSANATSAAFTGENVEFNVALAGRRKDVGIDKFLGDENARLSFSNMLHLYERSNELHNGENLREALEKMLEKGRKALSGAALAINIELTGFGSFTMALSSGLGSLKLPENVSGSCYPITLPEIRAHEIIQLGEMGKITFHDLSLEALTGFIAFKLVAKKNSEKAGISFVLNLPVKGLPEDRDKRILLNILSDQETFIRYLLLILGGEDGSGMNKPKGTGSASSKSNGGQLLPLFEEMVRAFSRDPDKIDRIAKVIDDLKVSGNLDKILPTGFCEMWKAFREERL